MPGSLGDTGSERSDLVAHVVRDEGVVVTAPACRPGQSRTISTNFQLLPIKERAVSAQKSEMIVRFSTSGTGATTCSHCAQRGLKQPRLHLTRNHERPASVHSIPGPFAPTPIEAGASRLRLGIAKASGPDFCAPQARVKLGFMVGF